ncbi:orf91 [Sucra jujuba nucleopolyhedrovirus]|uniref:Orf91 n=1 Tax=Sucra jujuba nucleopolyhedrovirus TaxID=1563660 RepID=A0A097P923_9ABAC|nr:orf91 [Sucra jujuba nucleopolyhedrovirus]AIU41330.1 orf91 [Sucra jujuba nucleopolyhedrovirus]
MSCVQQKSANINDEENERQLQLCKEFVADIKNQTFQDIVYLLQDLINESTKEKNAVKSCLDTIEKHVLPHLSVEQKFIDLANQTPDQLYCRRCKLCNHMHGEIPHYEENINNYMPIIHLFCVKCGELKLIDDPFVIYEENKAFAYMEHITRINKLGATFENMDSDDSE